MKKTPDFVSNMGDESSIGGGRSDSTASTSRGGELDARCRLPGRRDQVAAMLNRNTSSPANISSPATSRTAQNGIESSIEYVPGQQRRPRQPLEQPER